MGKMGFNNAGIEKSANYSFRFQCQTVKPGIFQPAFRQAFGFDCFPPFFQRVLGIQKS